MERPDKIRLIKSILTGKLSVESILPRKIFHWYDLENTGILSGLVNGKGVAYTDAQFRAFAGTCNRKSVHIVHKLQEGNEPLSK